MYFLFQGVFPNEIFTILSSIPEAEKFSKFWVCKAKLLASKGPFDAAELYEEAVKHGAAVSICLGWMTENSPSCGFFFVVVGN